VKEPQEILEGEAIEDEAFNRRNYALLADIPVRMSVEVGSAALRLSELMDLAEGSVVELDRQSHELLDIMANGTLVAKGEVVTVNGRFGIRVLEVVAAGSGLGGIERRK
jgi:flagellar motor switch protein FliN/FliY